MATKAKQCTCSCRHDSPFLWHSQYRPSIFYEDPYFRGKTGSQAMTAHVDQQRAEGKLVGVIAGISRNREEEILRLRTFVTYSKAMVNDKQQRDTVPTVRGMDIGAGVEE